MARKGRGYSWPQALPGNQLARKHGAFALDAEAEAKRLVPELFGQDDRERFPVVTLMFAEIYVRRQRALADIADRGVTVGSGKNLKDNPLLKHVSAWERTLLDLSARFGLDPKSESDLIRSKADGLKLMSDLEGLKERGRQARLAAEERRAFEPETEPGEAS